MCKSCKRYDKEITITICAYAADQREFWSLAFERFFGSATIVRGTGTWEGLREPNIQVSHLYNSGDNDIDWDAFDVLVKEYKADADQFAVLVVYRQVNGKLF